MKIGKVIRKEEVDSKGVFASTPFISIMVLRVDEDKDKYESIGGHVAEHPGLSLAKEGDLVGYEFYAGGLLSEAILEKFEILTLAEDVARMDEASAEETG